MRSCPRCWTCSAASPPVPRAGLSRAAVVELGAQVADETGADRLTLAGVAARAGVRLPSLYKHVGGLDDLQRGVAVQALGELLPTGMGGDTVAQ